MVEKGDIFFLFKDYTECIIFDDPVADRKSGILKLKRTTKKFIHKKGSMWKVELCWTPKTFTLSKITGSSPSFGLYLTYKEIKKYFKSISDLRNEKIDSIL